MKNFFYISLAAIALLSCSGRSSEKSVGSVPEAAVEEETIFTSLGTKATDYTQGDTVVIVAEAYTNIDSAYLTLDGGTISGEIEGGKVTWRLASSKDSKVGRRRYSVEINCGGEKESRQGEYLLFPTTPEEARLEVTEKYPHSRKSYTQGLEFYNGKLYESCGEYGVSRVEIMEFPKMKSIAEYKLEDKYFGEGITILNNKLYLLTWQEKVAFILDAKTLKPIKTIPFNTEGWGITNDGKNIYVSDGSANIYVRDPETFEIKDKLQVFTPRGELYSINELEWIDGEIWANVYTADLIVRINPKTGAVTGVISAEGLLSKNDYDDTTDVLNGIAHDSKGDLYVTGKNWPWLFKVKIKNV